MHELAPGTLAAIEQVSTSLHKAGRTSPHVLDATLRHTEGRRHNRSMETGCGATTLLLPISVARNAKTLKRYLPSRVFGRLKTLWRR